MTFEQLQLDMQYNAPYYCTVCGAKHNHFMCSTCDLCFQTHLRATRCDLCHAPVPFGHRLCADCRTVHRDPHLLPGHAHALTVNYALTHLGVQPEAPHCDCGNGHAPDLQDAGYSPEGYHRWICRHCVTDPTTSCKLDAAKALDDCAHRREIVTLRTARFWGDLCLEDRS